MDSSRSTERLTLVTFGVIRLGFAGWLAVRPRDVARRAGADPRGRLPAAVVSAVAARELVLGAGTLRAVRRGGGAGWVAAQGLADATDTLVLLTGAQRGVLDRVRARRAALLAFSGVGAEATVLLLRAAPRREPALIRRRARRYPRR